MGSQSSKSKYKAGFYIQTNKHKHGQILSKPRWCVFRKKWIYKITYNVVIKKTKEITEDKIIATRRPPPKDFK